MWQLRIALYISYDGTAYSGWQKQPNALTIQEVLEQALSKILRQEISVMGCGRTDAGVHALDFCLHFDMNAELPNHFVFRMNQLLPKDIAVKECKQVSDTFHSRFDALSRTYIYRINTQKDPFLWNKSLLVHEEPNLKLLNDCCTILCAFEDFASFARSGGDNKTTLCDIMEAKWYTTENGFEFKITANRFLRNMVRAVVGTMLDVAMGKTSLIEFKEIIEAKDRRKSSKSAAACGLYLAEIKY